MGIETQECSTRIPEACQIRMLMIPGWELKPIYSDQSESEPTIRMLMIPGWELKLPQEARFSSTPLIRMLMIPGWELKLCKAISFSIALLRFECS